MVALTVSAGLLLGGTAAQAHKGCHTKQCVKRVKIHKTHPFCNTIACVKRVDRKRYNRYVAHLPFVGPDGRRWAIPWHIIQCESGGSWGAYNPSGASGPYQLLGWGAPMPADTFAKKLVHHRIAARLWAGGRGRSHWVC